MKRKPLLFMSVLLAGLLVVGQSGVYAHEEKDAVKNVQLSPSQQKELETLYKDLFQKHEQIINKYVEYGVFSKEKADKILSHMEERQTKLKANGYVPKWDRNKHHSKKHHSKMSQTQE